MNTVLTISNARDVEWDRTQATASTRAGNSAPVNPQQMLSTTIPPAARVQRRVGMSDTANDTRFHGLSKAQIAQIVVTIGEFLAVRSEGHSARFVWTSGFLQMARSHKGHT